MATADKLQFSAPDGDPGKSALASANFLELLTADQRTSLLQLGSNRVYRPGQFLMHEGDSADVAIVVLRGLAKVTIVSEGGKELLLGLRGTGDLLGEMAILSKKDRSATVVAATELLGCVIGAASFVGYLERSPQVANCVSDIVADKLRAANRRRLEFNVYSADARVVFVLEEISLRYGHREGSTLRIGPEITQADLASLASASVRTIEKVLRAMEDHGMVARRRRDLIVTDVAGLQARCTSFRGTRRRRD